MKIYSMLLLSFVLTAINVWGQNQNFDKCGTDAWHQSLLQTDSAYQSQHFLLEQQIQSIIQNQQLQKMPSQVYEIPVVVHVIHLGESIGSGSNISTSQIQGAIDGLNDRFRGVIGNGVDTEIEFCLASTDPNGNFTNGINRVDGSSVANYSSSGIGSSGSSSGCAPANAIKDLSKWPVLEYYNIWVVHAICGNLAGYANLPFGGAYDGTVINRNHMTYSTTTLTHEVGHGFDLYHTFQGDDAGSICPPDNNCNSDGDKVCDTPPHKRTDCSTNTCSSSGTWDNSRHNYMGSSGTLCLPRDRFTTGQKNRLVATLQAYPRANLLSSPGCGATASSCSGFTNLTNCSGTFTDGSGVNDYINYSDCKWLIQPSGAGSVTLSFSSFITESGYDFVNVYDGTTTSDSLLGSFSGSSLPASITSTDGNMLVHFTSDSVTAASGWSANYSCTSLSCSDTTYLTNCSGSFTDESGANDYLNNTDCKWLIQPSSATSITLSFSSFNIEAGYDFVNVYDGTTTLAPSLGSFSGSSLPSSVTSTGGNMLVHFTTDGVVTAPGWSANYTCAGGQPNLATQSDSLGISTSTITVFVRAINNGSDPANSCQLAYYASTDLVIDNYDYLIGTSYVSNLLTGNTTDIYFTKDLCAVDSLPNGTYYIGYIIDYQNSISESDETDNVNLFTSPTATINCATGINDLLFFDSFKLYPNPNTGEFVIEVTKLQEIEIKLLNVIGQVLYKEKLNKYSGVNQKTINVGDQAAGIYTLQLITDQTTMNKRIIIEK